MRAEKNRRILVVDDNRAIHDDFRKILARDRATSRLDELEAAVLGGEAEARDEHYVVDSAYQGPEGLELVRSTSEAGHPYAVAFVDMRMPPSWDGVQTIEKIWELDSAIQVVLCTAYSDYSWSELQKRLGATDRLLLLKKPFDVVEVRQLACALTEKWQMAREAEALRSALLLDLGRRKEVEKLKDELISTVSHELRTPLTSIRGALGLLEGGVMGGLPDDALDLVHIARQNADRLTRLINDMLDLSKIEEGSFELEMGPLSAPRLVGTALDELRPAAVAVGVELRAGEAVQESVVGDEARLVQVLGNLISNAIKFSPRGAVVEVGVRPAAPGRIRFFVSDHGVGIGDSQRAMLFGKFQQLDASDSRGSGGTGLGLALSKAIVERHGGEIGVSSQLGRGSTFWFDLPALASA